MARGRRPAVDDRGDVRISAGRASVSALVAVAGAAGLGAFAALGSGDALPVVGTLSALAAAALAAGLWRERSMAVPWSVLALGAAGAVSFAQEGDPARSPLYAAGLLAVAELAYWSLESRVGEPAVGGIVPRRLALLSGLVAGSIAVGAVLLSVARVDAGGGLALEAIGVAAVIAAVALVFGLSRRTA